MPEVREKCAHPGCNCEAAEESRYCGRYCEQAGPIVETRCGCGHPDCGATVE